MTENNILKIYKKGKKKKKEIYRAKEGKKCPMLIVIEKCAS